MACCVVLLKRLAVAVHIIPFMQKEVGNHRPIALAFDYNGLAIVVMKEE